MIVKNEERFLRDCLASVHDIVDEICVVDTGSSDATVEIATSFGARVEHRTWRNDFGWARNEALAMATRRWILVLDADEIVRAESRAGFQSLRDVPADLTGLWVRCFNVVDDYKGTGVSSHALARFFPNNPRIRYRSPIHEFITLDGLDTGIDCRNAPLAIDHYGYLNSIVKERKKGDRNLEIIRAALASDPEDPFHWYNLGTTALIEKRFEEGIVALEKMFAIVGTTPRGFVPAALAFLADAYMEHRGDFERGILFAREALKRSPNFANAHFILGRGLFKLARYEEAMVAYKAAIASGAYNTQQFLVDDEVSVWKAQSEIGATYGRLRDNVSALHWFDEGLKNRPSVLPLMLNRARCLEALSRFPEAEAQFRACWETFTDDQTATDYVNYLLRRQEHTRALAVMDAILDKVAPRTAALLAITGAAVAELAGQSERAPELVQRALKLAPGAAPVVEAAEKYFFHRGDTAAMEALRAAELQVPPVAMEDYVRRSSRMLALGDYAAAEAIAAEGRETFGDHPGLVYDLAAATVQRGDREAALALLECVGVQEADTFAKAAFLRSVILADLGRFDEAVDAIDGVLELAPGNPDATLHRVKILAAMGRTADIEHSLRQALSSGDERIAVELAGLLVQAGRYDEARSIADAALATR